MGNMAKAIIRKENLKMIFVIRTDLKLLKSEIAQLVAKCVIELNNKKDTYKTYNDKLWRNTGQAKIVVKIKGEKNLLEIYEKCFKQNIKSVFLIDKLSKMKKEEICIVGIGPAKNKYLDEITGHLKLL